MNSFSILIPSWNNLPYLQLCISSIQKNSHFKNQIIVFINEGKDGTLDWLKGQHDVEFLYSEKNEGVCVAMNLCRKLVRSEFMIYMNDDMYVCPGWDLALSDEIGKIGHDRFMLSATAIEPYKSKNPSVVSIVKNFGDSIESFREDELLATCNEIMKDDWYGASWPPSVISTRMWDIIGGYSIEFSPGMYSDPDFSMKLWKYGVRIFKGVGSSKIYHFQSKSTKRLRKNKGSDTFLTKWGITAKTFYQHYLKMGQTYENDLPEVKSLPPFVGLKNTLKRIYRSI